MAEEIRAEMTATVWKVLVAPGDRVSEGDTVVVLESMKMEIPIPAESDGTVARVVVQPGETVQEGDLVVEIDRQQATTTSW